MSTWQIPTADLMKKGLRPHTPRQCSAPGAHSNRRPDEEGIKTYQTPYRASPERNSNRRPDEEGIKTVPSRHASRRRCIPTADLMKKGLRRMSAGWLTNPWIPTADLMKKGLRQLCPGSSAQAWGIPTADLMKKGLRQKLPHRHRCRHAFQPQT